MPTEDAVRADLFGHACDFPGKGIEVIDHAVDGLLQLQDLALDIDGDLPGQVAPGDGSRYFGDVAHLGGQVGRQTVDVVGEVFPRSRDALDLCLPAEDAFIAHLPSYTGDLPGESVQLIDHRVDGVLEVGHLALDVYGDLLREIALSHSGGHLSDVAHLTREVIGQLVDVVGEVFPRSRDPFDLGLSPKLTLGAHLLGHAGDLAGKSVEVVHHRVDGLFQLQDLALDVHGDLLREIALGHGSRHLGDVTDLPREVVGQLVDVVGEVFPRSRDPFDFGLPAELTLGTHFFGHAGDLAGKSIKVVDHRVDGLFQLQDLALSLNRDFLRKITLGHGGAHFGDVAHLAREVVGQLIDVVGEIFPGARNSFDLRLPAKFTFRAHLPRHPRHFCRKLIELIDHRVDDSPYLSKFTLQGPAVDFRRHLLGQIAFGDGQNHAFRFVNGLGQITDERIQGIPARSPCSPNASQRNTLFQVALFADGLADSNDLTGETLVQADHFVEHTGHFAQPVFHGQADGEIAVFYPFYGF